jgi:hypothetical protein
MDLSLAVKNANNIGSYSSVPEFLNPSLQFRSIFWRHVSDKERY